jgi:hypothetical protein
MKVAGVSPERNASFSSGQPGENVKIKSQVERSDHYQGTNSP